MPLNKDANMKLPILIILLLLSANTYAETKYYCEGDTTRTMNNGPRVEDPDNKTYVFNGNEIEFFTDRVKCSQDKKAFVAVAINSIAHLKSTNSLAIQPTFTKHS